MQKFISSIAVLLVITSGVFGQNTSDKHSRSLNFTSTIGKAQGAFAGSYIHNWRIGARKRLDIGVGGRWTTYVGLKKDFLTAGPAKYTRSFTVPFIIFFAGQEEQNFDTLTVQRPLTHSLNAMINIGYRVSPKWYAGFNIDVIGVSFGRKSSGIFTSNGTTQTEPKAKVAPFNVLLTGDHDRGTLNSEFYLRYQIANRWAITALYQFLFVEYQTTNLEQRFMDGTTNDRFRNKANNVGLGISYLFN
ncbi:MAG: hypothetical protein H7Y31_06815 [Chitinophagaceae bacterium]|nr:hypothetical protein [Chitinophagaceae bacterium]